MNCFDSVPDEMFDKIMRYLPQPYLWRQIDKRSYMLSDNLYLSCFQNIAQQYEEGNLLCTRRWKQFLGRSLPTNLGVQKIVQQLFEELRYALSAYSSSGIVNFLPQYFSSEEKFELSKIYSDQTYVLAKHSLISRINLCVRMASTIQIRGPKTNSVNSAIQGHHIVDRWFNKYAQQISMFLIDLTLIDKEPLCIEIGAISFSCLQALTRLNICSKYLVELPIEIFRLPRLSYLTIDCPNLRYLPDHISRLSNMQSLCFSHSNFFNTMICEVKPGLVLEELCLESCGLKIVPAQIKSLTNLKVLDLKHNKLNCLSPDIKYLQSLTSLNLSNNRLRTLPNEIALLTKLTLLRMQGNQLRRLPAQCCALQSLWHLDAGNNNFYKLPFAICQMYDIRCLHLERIKLLQVPMTIGQLTNLTDLDLQGNSLQYLPQSIGQLDSLVELQLQNNTIEQLPRSISKCTRLSYINLSYNHLINVEESFWSLTQLCGLDLSFNCLNSLPLQLTCLVKLEMLKITNNPLIESVSPLLSSTHEVLRDAVIEAYNTGEN